MLGGAPKREGQDGAMISEMVERVAKAIFANKRQTSGLTLAYLPNWRECVPDARSAIAAMREPTSEMELAGEICECNETVIWKAMIDAAIDETVTAPTHAETATVD